MSRTTYAQKNKNQKNSNYYMHNYIYDPNEPEDLSYDLPHELASHLSNDKKAMKREFRLLAQRMKRQY